MKLVHNVTSDSFKRQIETEFPELFKGIHLMDGEISIKLQNGAIPHEEPIRHVPHAMQEPIKRNLINYAKRKSFIRLTYSSQLSGLTVLSVSKSQMKWQR